jgi:cytochrome c oxidase subunit 4
MSTTETPDTESSQAHPSPREYVHIALVLAVLTALEVSTYFFDFGVIAIPLLVVLMVVKFLYVAGWFMHLKFDSPIYSRLMYTGLAFALVLYAIVAAILLFERARTI